VNNLFSENCKLEPEDFKKLPFDEKKSWKISPTLGNQNKLVMVYKEPFWRAQGNSGTITNYGNEGLPFSCLDHSPINSTAGVIICFSAGDYGARLWTKTQVERQEIVLSFLVSYLGPNAKNLLSYIDQDWMAEPYIGGGATVYWPPGVITGHGGALATPFGRVTWAGCDTASPTDAHFGWIDQAIHTGRTAAARIAKELQEPHATLGRPPLSSLLAFSGGVDAGTTVVVILACVFLVASLAARGWPNGPLRKPLLQ